MTSTVSRDVLWAVSLKVALLCALYLAYIKPVDQPRNDAQSTATAVAGAWLTNYQRWPALMAVAGAGLLVPLLVVVLAGCAAKRSPSSRAPVGSREPSAPLESASFRF